MHLRDQIRINAPRKRVFAALNDIVILKQAIPGCEEIEALSPTEFAATVSSKVGPLKARFKGSVSLSDIVPPESYTLSGEGKGGPAGHARITSRVRLEEDGRATVLHYDVNADIGGKLAQLGGHLVEKTAQKLAAEFFQKFEALVNADGDIGGGIAEAAAAATASGRNMGWLWLAGGAVALLAIAWLAL